jgi:uncharacterized protein YegJ (DUF2314 family)
MVRVIAFFLFIGCGAVQSGAQSLEDRVARDELALVDESDPIMVAAIRKGRETLPSFLKLAQSPQRAMSHFAVKVPVRAGGQYEYFWIADFKSEDGRYSGRIDNTPRWAKHLKEGDIIVFEEREIVDWLYVRDNKMVGNFTFCALMQRERREDALAQIRRLRADCKR